MLAGESCSSVTTKPTLDVLPRPRAVDPREVVVSAPRPRLEFVVPRPRLEFVVPRPRLEIVVPRPRVELMVTALADLVERRTAWVVLAIGFARAPRVLRVCLVAING